jgi:hypothetical protein
VAGVSQKRKAYFTKLPINQLIDFLAKITKKFLKIGAIGAFL